MKKFLIILVLLFVTVTFSHPKIVNAGNGDINNIQNDQVVEQYLIPLLNALKNRNKAEMYQLWGDKVESKKSDQSFEMYFDWWNGRDWSTVKKLSEKKRNVEGNTPGATTYRYNVMNEKEKLEIEFAVRDDNKNIDRLYITTAPLITGTLATWRQFNLAQWLITGLAIAEILFSLYMAFLCIKKRPKLWGLWLVFILSIYGGIGFSTNGNFILSFFLYTFAFPKILNHSGLGFQVYLSVPIGAVIFFSKVHKKVGTIQKEEQ